MRYVPSLSLLALTILPPAAAKPIDPAGKWVIDFAEHQCTATLPFVHEGKAIRFVMRPSLGGDVMQLAILQKGSAMTASQREIKLVLSDGDVVKGAALSYGVGSTNLQLVNLDPDARDRLAKTSSIEWKSGDGSYALNVGPLRHVLGTLSQCRKDLRQFWNMEDAERSRIKQSAQPDKPLIEYFSDDDYPYVAIRNEQQGATSMVLLIDEQGKVRDCMVEKTSNVPVLDVMSCFVLRKRAHYKPAIDIEGKAVRSADAARIRWAIP